MEEVVDLISASTLMTDPMSVIFLDIDRFKAIHDTHGDDAGDDVLRRFARVISSGIRSSGQQLYSAKVCGRDRVHAHEPGHALALP